MRQPLGSRTLQGAVILLGIWSLVRAHGHDEDGVVREIAATVAAGAPPQLLPSSSSTNISETAPSYFNYQTHGSLLYAHIVFMSIAWVFVLPPALALSIARSRVALPVQISFLVVHALGLVTGAVYNRKTPDLYPQNVHHGLGWLLTIVVAGQTVLGLIGLYARPARKGGQEAYEDEQQTGFIPVSMEALAEYHRIQPAYDTRFSRDSGQGTERVSNSIPSAFSSPRDERPDRQLGEVDHHEDDHLLDDEKSSTKQGQRRWRLWISALTSRASGRVLQIGTIVYNITDRLLLPLGFAGIASGIIVYSGIFHGKHIFNGLAHFVKGGIFVWYGFLTLGRWMGCFADLGWAWNVRPEQKKPTVRRSSIEMPSAEFIESAVIFIYGASNVFLEHLAAWGEAWTAQDFEHVSISIMFFGGGLAGMLVESKRIRNLLNASIMSSMSMVGRPSSSSSSSMDPPKTYRFSMNPFPALIIMLLGMMMSSHHQMSMISTMMHKQWGTLFVGFALARAITYLMIYLSPPTSILPSRPPSELVASFCLLSGGLIFMASNRDTVTALEKFHLNAMFIFTLTMGFTAFFMAWAMLVVATKGWGIRCRYPGRGRGYSLLGRHSFDVPRQRPAFDRGEARV